MNETPSDTKTEPKFTFEQALKAMQPQIDALLKATLKGFEVGDKNSFKRVFGAFVHAGMETVLQGAKDVGVTDVKAYSLARRAEKAASGLTEKFQPSKPPKLEAIDGGLDDEDESDDDEDEGDDGDGDGQDD